MKNSYSVDNNNRLVINRNGKKLIPKGEFNVDNKNQLLYRLNQPQAWRREYNLPSKICFRGNWRLNHNHDLGLKLTQDSRQYKNDRLALKGNILSADRDALVFEIITHQGQSPSTRVNRVTGTVPGNFQLLKLGGCWQADKYNRLIFTVKKKADPDVLTLENSWEINKNQQIVYSYEKTNLKTKTKSAHSLNFTGFWQINAANKLTYILERGLKSAFIFRAQAESPNLYPQSGVIKYRIGIGLKQKKEPYPNIIFLYGEWKFSRKLGLTFQMDYGKNKVHNIEFGTDIFLNQKDKISFTLKDAKGKPLGLCVSFTHRFLNKLDAEAFLRAKKALQAESAVEAGVRIPF